MGQDTVTVVPPGDQATRLWHVTLLLAGASVAPTTVRAGLERLADEHPFLLCARYAEDRAELRYWEEADCLDDAAALALRLWGEHRRSAALPDWRVAGLEVVDRETYQWRAGQRSLPPMLTVPGGIRPF